MTLGAENLAKGITEESAIAAFVKALTVPKASDPMTGRIEKDAIASSVRKVQEGLDELSRILDRGKIDGKTIRLSMARGAFSTLTKFLGPMSGQTVDGNERLEKVAGRFDPGATKTEQDFMGLMKWSLLNPVETIAGARGR